MLNPSGATGDVRRKKFSFPTFGLKNSFVFKYEYLVNFSYKGPARLKSMAKEQTISFLRLTWMAVLTGIMSLQLSCYKDESTLPVRLALSVNIAERLKTDHDISFESGEIVLNEVQFDGTREVGEDYSFYTEPDKVLGPRVFYQQPGSSSALAFFDLPQGIYTLMDWRFQLSDGLGKFVQDDDSETPGLILNGTYTRVNGGPVQVRLEIDPFESFECKAVNEGGNRTIDIISDKKYNASLYFDPYFAFRPISPNTIEKADYSDGVLLISSDFNVEIYEVILYRLQQSARIVVSG